MCHLVVSGTGSRVLDMGRHQDVALWLQHHPNHTLPSIRSSGIKCKHRSWWRLQVLHSLHDTEIASHSMLCQGNTEILYSIFVACVQHQRIIL